jgi:hypothetical protein
MTEELRRLLAEANEGPLPAHREALLAWAAVDALPGLLDRIDALEHAAGLGLAFMADPEGLAEAAPQWRRVIRIALARLDGAS